MAAAGEDSLIRWLRRRLGPGSLVGDDAALLPPGSYAATVDSQIEGVHFVPGLDPALVARRLLAVNLSDLAATGADPAFALLALTARRGFDHRRFFRGLLAACKSWHVELAGGDLATSPGPVTATLTLLGTCPPGGRPLRRDGARPGHALWLGGTVGESAAGGRLVASGARLAGGKVALPPGWDAHPEPLRRAARRAVRRHLLPTPQLALSGWLRQQQEGGALDVSDGVSKDLHRLCRESGVGAAVEAAALPLPPGFHALCRVLAARPDDLRLAGGEDYVLLFTLPREIAVPREYGCRRIGEITVRRRVVLLSKKGVADLEERGFDHLSIT